MQNITSDDIILLTRCFDSRITLLNKDFDILRAYGASREILNNLNNEIGELREVRTKFCKEWENKFNAN